MNEKDRENQDEYNAMQNPVDPGFYPKVDSGTAVTYTLVNTEWDARWPSNVRLPVSGEWIIFEDDEGEEVSYIVKTVDWFFNATGDLGVRIGLK